MDDTRALDELLDEEGADAELERELASSVDALEQDLEKLELAALLSGEYDSADAIGTINAGAGGTESQDWAEMLLRMYTRWAEQHGFDLDLDEIHHGEEAGIKSRNVHAARAERIRSPVDRAGRAPAGADQSVRRAEATAHVVR